MNLPQGNALFVIMLLDGVTYCEKITAKTRY